MPIINSDYDSSNQFNPVDLLDHLTQNDIDFLCKTFQVWHDYIFGEDNDDASLSQLQPFTCSFVGCIDTDVRAFGGQSVILNGAGQTKAHCLYSFSFDGYNAYYSGLQPIYANAILNQTTETGINNLAIYVGGCEAAANGSSLVSDRKQNIDYTNDRCIDGCYNPTNYQKDYIYPCSYNILLDSSFQQSDWGFHKSAMQKYYNIFDTVYTYGDSTNLRTSVSDVVCLDFYNPPAYIDENATPQSGYYKNFSLPAWSNTYKGTPLKPFKGKGAFVSIGANVSDTFVNNYIDETYNNNFNYVSNEGDNITVYYGDNYINIGGGGSGSGDGVTINYFDLEDILQRIVDDLNVNSDLDIELTVPTFEEIKYSDRGSMYIGKWNEYPKNIAPRPVAVDVINNDLAPSDGILPEWTATVGTILSTGVNGFMSILPDWIGVLLGVCFLTAFFARNMRKGG